MSAALIDPEDTRFRLGVEAMDAVHSAFIALTNALADADQADFLTLFKQLIEHTQAHFDQEEQWMTETRFPALQEHRGDHRRVLADLRAIGQRSTRVKLGGMMAAEHPGLASAVTVRNRLRASSCSAPGAGVIVLISKEQAPYVPLLAERFPLHAVLTLPVTEAGVEGILRQDARSGREAAAQV
jgi:hemerythrin-like metal-binding protein